MAQADSLLCQNYLKGSGGIAGRIGDIYDELTRHGTNRLPEAEAIRMAFEQYEREAAPQRSSAPQGSSAK
jgi:hypothetical protein